MWPRLLLLSFFLCLQVVTSFHNHVHRGTHLPLHTKFLRRDDYACDANSMPTPRLLVLMNLSTDWQVDPCRNGACCGGKAHDRLLHSLASKLIMVDDKPVATVATDRPTVVMAV